MRCLTANCGSNYLHGLDSVGSVRCNSTEDCILVLWCWYASVILVGVGLVLESGSVGLLQSDAIPYFSGLRLRLGLGPAGLSAVTE